MDEWIEKIKCVGVYIILGEMLLHLVPGKEYEKYFRFILDMSVVAIIFLPLLTGGTDLAGAEEYFPIQAETVLAEDMREFEDSFNEHLQNVQENIAEKMEEDGGVAE